MSITRRKLLQSIIRLGAWFGIGGRRYELDKFKLDTSTTNLVTKKNHTNSKKTQLSDPLNSSFASEYDCLILGGGLAGMAAANALAFPTPDTKGVNAHSRRVLVIEGQGRLGGRLCSQQPPGFPSSIELGAQYVHVDDVVDSNGKRQSLWVAFKRWQIQIAPIHRLFCGFGYSKYFSGFFRRHWQMFMEYQLNWLINFRDQITSYRGKDMSFREWLDSHRYTTKQRALVDILLAGPASGHPNSMSLNGFNLDRFASMESGDHEYQVKPSWSYFIEQLKFPAPEQNAKNGTLVKSLEIKYHSSVKKIEYHQDGVVVTVHERQQGRPGPNWDNVNYVTKIYRAKTAIITFPIGVLRKAVGIDPSRAEDVSKPNSSFEFSPPLPSRKMRALRAIGAGVAAKMFIVFESRFWDEQMGMLNRLDGLSRMGRVYFVQNFQNEPANYILGAYLGGDECMRIARLDEEQILFSICRELAEMYPEVDRERPILDRVRRDSTGKPIYAYKNWAHDKWSYCNDSFLRFDPHGSGDDIYFARSELASAKHTGALFWAGEATAYDDGSKEYAFAHPGVTHGAHRSGMRAAQEVSEYLAKRKNSY